MKKIIFTGVAAIFELGVFFACGKDEESKKCTCTESGDGYSATRELDPASYGATNCSDLEIKLRMQSGDSDYDYSCK